MNRLPRFFTLALLLVVALFVSAQEDPEYRMEVGGGVGLWAYQGDFNGSLTKGMKPAFIATAKYRMNPRMAWALGIGYGKLKGASTNVTTWYPGLSESPVEFSTGVTSVDIAFEYNFWPYGTGREYRGAKPFTPFITLGLGVAAGKANESFFAAQMPIGVGVKYKIATRLNLTAQWTMHFTGTDKIDGATDPYGIKSSGIFKNTDSFSAFQLTLTYDFWAKCKVCNNDRD